MNALNCSDNIAIVSAFRFAQTRVIGITATGDDSAAPYGLMASPPTHRLRLVIQRVEIAYPPRSTYRLVAYPAPPGLSLRPATFHSREEVITCLQAALPGF